MYIVSKLNFSCNLVPLMEMLYTHSGSECILYKFGAYDETYDRLADMHKLMNYLIDVGIYLN